MKGLVIHSNVASELHEKLQSDQSFVILGKAHVLCLPRVSVLASRHTKVVARRQPDTPSEPHDRRTQ